jgi:hypothetical protein
VPCVQSVLEILENIMSHNPSVECWAFVSPLIQIIILINQHFSLVRLVKTI